MREKWDELGAKPPAPNHQIAQPSILIRIHLVDACRSAAADAPESMRVGLAVGTRPRAGLERGDVGTGRISGDTRACPIDCVGKRYPEKGMPCGQAQGRICHRRVD